MTNQPLDPRHEKLIAALYGELSADEEKVFFALLETDAELKRDWDELNETKGFMTSARSEEAGFEFKSSVDSEGFTFDASAIEGLSGDVYYTQPASPAPAQKDRARRPAWLTLLRTPAAGFAVMAAALVIMMLSGLRVDTIDGGMLVHFGPLPAQQSSPAGDMPGSYDLVPGSMQYASSDYITREELMRYTQNLLNVSEARLISQQDQQQKNLVRTVVGFCNEFSQEYIQNRRQTDEELEKIWFGLEGLERFGALRLNAPAGLDNTPHFTPVNQPENLETEDR